MSFISLLGLYLLGAYLRQCEWKMFSFGKGLDLTFYLALGLILAAVNAVLLYLGISTCPFGYLNPLVILQSVFLFLFFKKWELPYHSWINKIAAATFSVYLFHGSIYFFPTYSAMCMYANSFGTIWSLLVFLGIVVAIFLFCTIVNGLVNHLFEWGYSYKKRI